MKTSLLAIALAVATLPLTFAAQVPQANSGISNGAKVQTRSMKKHHKRHHVKKATVKAGGTATVSK